MRVFPHTRASASALITAFAALLGLVLPGLAGARANSARPSARPSAARGQHARSASTGGAGLGQTPGGATIRSGLAAQSGLGGGTPASTPAHPTVPGLTAAIINGIGYAPSAAPLAIKRAIWAGNDIRRKPYFYGGGHGSFHAAGYDCSGSVSYVLHAAGLLATPMDSSEFFGWGTGGLGQWITVFTNPEHAFVEIAGIRLDTSSQGDPGAGSGSGPRWRPLLGDTSAYTPRHFDNL